MKFSECALGPDQRYTCTCRPGFEAADDGKNCINEMTTPLNATECLGDEECANFPETVCWVNRIIPRASHIPGVKPAASSTRKRCQCKPETAEDSSQPFAGCPVALTATLGCAKHGGGPFCKSRNPDHICVPATQFCGCPTGTLADASGECKSLEKKSCSSVSDCPSLSEMDPLTSTDSVCDSALKRCSCVMKAQLAQPATKNTLFVPAIPAGTPGTPVYNAAKKLHQCSAVQAVTICKDDTNCAKDLNHTCSKIPTNNDFGYCMCKALKRHAAGGLVCSDVYGKCCNPNAGSQAFHCGMPLVAPKPGVSNLSCLPASGTCGCSSGYYQPDVGCVATPPNIGSQCDPLS